LQTFSGTAHVNEHDRAWQAGALDHGPRLPLPTTRMHTSSPDDVRKAIIELHDDAVVRPEACSFFAK
jgi:hypothetical protein